MLASIAANLKDLLNPRCIGEPHANCEMRAAAFSKAEYDKRPFVAQSGRSWVVRVRNRWRRIVLKRSFFGRTTTSCYRIGLTP